MRVACWIPKATNTHPEYVILIAFPLQQCMHERHTYIACFVICSCSFPSFFISSLFFLQSRYTEWDKSTNVWSRGFYVYIVMSRNSSGEFLRGYCCCCCGTLYSCSLQKQIRTVSCTHIRRMCVRNYHWVAGIFPEFDYWSVLCQECGKRSCPLHLYVSNYCLSKVLISLWN